MKTIYFNTGAHYTAFGQRITATFHDDGVVTFFDHDRKVDGEYKSSLPEQYFTEGAVMAMYDQGLAPNTERSWRDGMMPDGCNAKYKESVR